MIPTAFKEANMNYGPPSDLEESQCHTICAYGGTIVGGSIDGMTVSVVAWKPTAAELESIKSGEPIFLSVIGRLPPHFLSTSFHQATHPA